MSVPYLHFSVDDVFGCVEDLFTGGYASPWQQPTFAYLRRLHEAYGLVTSLYLFAGTATSSWELADADERHRRAFAAASTWLRFGFHAADDATRYSPDAVSPTVAARHYRTIVASIARFAGAESVDRAPRTHYFTGSEAAVRAWQGEELGPLGLLTPDDEREEAYHLAPAASAAIRARGTARDEAHGLWLFRTDVRLERSPDVTSTLRVADAALETGGAVHAFTHEQYLPEAAVRERLEALARYLAQLGITGAFPLDAARRAGARG